MSRVGILPITIPAGVSVSITSRVLTVKGKLGEMSQKIPENITVEQKDNQILLAPNDKLKATRMMWGTLRSIINNLVKGVNEGFTKVLEINGVGYRAQVQGQDLVLNLGFSHEVRFPIAPDIDVKCEKPTLIKISGKDYQRVGQVAAEIRSYRLPEPYKGKGIRVDNEYVERKEGKKK